MVPYGSERPNIGVKSHTEAKGCMKVKRPTDVNIHHSGGHFFSFAQLVNELIPAVECSTQVRLQIQLTMLLGLKGMERKGADGEGTEVGCSSTRCSG